MSRYMPLSFTLASLIALASTSDAFAHCFVGARFFPATLATDDPCVADEMSLPTVSWSRTADVPPAVESYSQDIAASDIGAVLDGLAIAEPAHLVGVSMGAASVLQFALRCPARVRSITPVSIGTGSDATREEHQAQMEETARLIDEQGMAARAAAMADAPNRHKLKDKDRAAYDSFIAEISALSPLGSASTMRGVQKRRPPLYAHEAAIRTLRVPALVVVGEDDAGCRKPSEFLARTLPMAELVVVPDTGHGVNLEEPALFNARLLAFIEAH